VPYHRLGVIARAGERGSRAGSAKGEFMRRSVGKGSYYSEAMTIPFLHCLEELLGVSRTVEGALQWEVARTLPHVGDGKDLIA